VGWYCETPSEAVVGVATNTSKTGVAPAGDIRLPKSQQVETDAFGGDSQEIDPKVEVGFLLGGKDFGVAVPLGV
jgi:hypothetical protein